MNVIHLAILDKNVKFNLNLMLNAGYIGPTTTNSYQWISPVCVLIEICVLSYREYAHG
jgi:hypothetical protein